MGAWGSESYSNDTVMDELSNEEFFRDYDNPTQQEVDNYFQNGRGMEISLQHDYLIDIIGVLVWILNKGMRVDSKTLKLANDKAIPKMIADEKDKTYPWVERIQYLKMEQKIIQSAIKNDGVATLIYASLGGDVLTHGPSDENHLIKVTKKKSSSPRKKSTNTSKKRSRKTSKKTSRKRSRKTSKKRSRKTSKKRSRKRSRKTSQKRSRKTSRKRSRKTSRKRSRKTSRKTRPSPSMSATKAEVGTILQGNDGNMWIVKANINGVHRWVKRS